MMEAGLDGLALLDNFEGIERGIVIDAMQSGHDTGTIVRLEIPRDLDQLSEFTWSSHDVIHPCVRIRGRSHVGKYVRDAASLFDNIWN